MESLAMDEMSSRVANRRHHPSADFRGVGVNAQPAVAELKPSRTDAVSGTALTDAPITPSLPCTSSLRSGTTHRSRYVCAFDIRKS